MIAALSDPVSLALIALVGNIVALVVGAVTVWMKLHEVKEVVNGRMGEMLEVVKKASKAEGVKEGEANAAGKS